MLLRFSAMVAIILWAVALALPATMHASEYYGGPVDPKTVGTGSGLNYLLFGAFGPVVLDLYAYDLPGYGNVPHLAVAGVPLAAFGWYAHPFWMLNVIRMLLLNSPRAMQAIVSAILAALALGPYHIAIFNDLRPDSMTVPVKGAFLWATAMAIPLAVVLGEKLARAMTRSKLP